MLGFILTILAVLATASLIMFIPQQDIDTEIEDWHNFKKALKK